jgi:hypothetical protein
MQGLDECGPGRRSEDEAGQRRSSQPAVRVDYFGGPSFTITVAFDPPASDS